MCTNIENMVVTITKALGAPKTPKLVPLTFPVASGREEAQWWLCEGVVMARGSPDLVPAVHNLDRHFRNAWLDVHLDKPVVL